MLILRAETFETRTCRSLIDFESTSDAEVCPCCLLLNEVKSPEP